jgi:hypothetical protein
VTLCLPARPPLSVERYVQNRCPDCWPFFYGTVGAVRVHAPVEVSSWWRSTACNAEARGKETSQHLYGVALDVVGAGARDVADQLRAFGWTVLDEGNHWHAQVFPANPFT